MNEYLKEYIDLKKKFTEQDEDKDSVLALYQFADRLALIDEKDAKEVLVDLYQQLCLMESAFKLFVNICDKNDRKQIKKLANLQNLSQSHGDRFALPRPLLRGVQEGSALRIFRFLSTIQIHLRLVRLKRERKRFVLVAEIKVRSTIHHFRIALRMWSISVQHAYQMEKQQGSLTQNLYKMLSGMASLIWKRMTSFFIVRLVT